MPYKNTFSWWTVGDCIKYMAPKDIPQIVSYPVSSVHYIAIFCLAETIYLRIFIHISCGERLTKAFDVTIERYLRSHEMKIYRMHILRCMG